MKHPPLWQRLLGALFYLSPLTTALPFGTALFRPLPLLGLGFDLVTLPVQLFRSLLNSTTSIDLGLGRFPVGAIVVFVLLFIYVIRTPRVPRPIRFNLLQVIVLDLIVGVLLQAFELLLQPLAPSLPFLVDTLQTTVFLLAVLMVLFGVVETLRGKEADIPTLSEAVRMQLF
jgi:hypothetical protein